jgi:hypothetical protein
MKKIKLYIVLAATALIGFACNPIEDQSLRENFENAGTPITQEELTAVLSVTQPFPYSQERGEGNQYVALKNSRPDIGGAWHYETKAGWKTINSDDATIIYSANGKNYGIYYEGISANRVVRSDTFRISVSDLPVDEYETYLTGAITANDLDAKRLWMFQDVNGALYNGMYGNWKYYDPQPGHNSWGTISTSTVEEKYMTFEFNDNKMTTHYADGSVAETGTWSVTHESPEGVAGEIYTTVPVLGTSQSWNVWSSGDPYWIYAISEDRLVLIFPSTYNKEPGVEDWDIDATYFYLVPKE